MKTTAPVPCDYYYDGQGGHCNICDPKVRFTSPKNAIAHIMGMRHQNTINQHPGIQVLGPDYIIKRSNDGKYQLGGNQSHLSKPRSNQKYDNAGMSNEPASTKQKYASINNNTTWYYCEVCDNCSNSKEQAKIHDMGKKHRKKMEAKIGKQLIPSSANPASIRPIGHGRSKKQTNPLQSNDQRVISKPIGDNIENSTVVQQLFELSTFYNIGPQIATTQEPQNEHDNLQDLYALQELEISDSGKKMADWYPTMVDKFDLNAMPYESAQNVDIPFF